MASIIAVLIMTCMHVSARQGRPLPVNHFLGDKILDQVTIELFHHVGIQAFLFRPLPAHLEHCSKTLGSSHRRRAGLELCRSDDVVSSRANRGDDVAVNAIDLTPDLSQGGAVFGGLHWFHSYIVACYRRAPQPE